MRAVILELAALFVGIEALVPAARPHSLASAQTKSLRTPPRMALGRKWLAGQTPRQQKKLLESKKYDYIIVGGGTAGCVLANRLSSKPDTNVLLIEAGTRSPKHPYVRIPVAILKLFKSAWDWDFATEPASNLAERSLYLCRGKGLGGSTCTNVMLYVRGAASDYDTWARECGDDSWTASSMLQYFKRAEDCLSVENTGVGEWHSRGGPSAVSDVPYQNPLSAAFLDAARQAGFPTNNDFNDWSKPQLGFGRFQVSQRGGERESAASAYLGADVRRRSNLDVLVGALVAKVELDDAKRAVGVDLRLGGSLACSAKLASQERAEVLLTAGAIGSPHVLMLSGIGASEELAKHDITCVADRSGVGKNLQDHPACLVSRLSNSAAPKSHSSLLRISGTTVTNPIATLQWMTKGRGPLTSPGCDHGGFLKLQPNDDTSSSTEADTQFRFLATKSITPDGMSTIATSYKTARNLPNGFTIQTVLARPKSKDGSVSLNSADPFDKPKIKSGYFVDKRDLTNMVAALKQARQLMAQPALAQYAGDEEFPGPRLTTDEQLTAYARETVHTANAIVGTCKLGMPSDDTAVVDNKLRVIGTQKLRVCDSSIMPTLPGGQTASATIAIAEKAADMIVEVDDSPAVKAPVQQQKVIA